MTWSEQFDKIQPGDVFVKPWGDRELVHVMLPRTPRSAKQPYMVLNGGHVDRTWNLRRSTYGNTTTQVRWRYVGTVPAAYLYELQTNWTLR